mmetsp:Transcript_81475/g.217940  ORF Transcript_81475/g.217940 Transcript_81475/m.217940 type:complete len:229 (-) Transcript_81475:119-805(-)
MRAAPPQLGRPVLSPAPHVPQGHRPQSSGMADPQHPELANVLANQLHHLVHPSCPPLSQDSTPVTSPQIALGGRVASACRRLPGPVGPRGTAEPRGVPTGPLPHPPNVTSTMHTHRTAPPRHSSSGTRFTSCGGLRLDHAFVLVVFIICDVIVRDRGHALPVVLVIILLTIIPCAGRTLPVLVIIVCLVIRHGGGTLPLVPILILDLVIRHGGSSLPLGIVAILIARS